MGIPHGMFWKMTAQIFFSKIIQIPADATKLYISLSSTPNSYQTSVYDISISRNKSLSTYITKKDTVTRVVFDAPLLCPLKQKVMAGEFCQFDIGPNTSNFCIINMKINKKTTNGLLQMTETIIFQPSN